ncbi:MAG: alkaline phosphatase family protein, partial [Propionibacteriaceae bacterium]
MSSRLTAEASAAADQMVIPAYQSSTLSDLTPGIGAHLGVPGYDQDPLQLPNAQRYVVVLIDGLGFHLVRRAIRDAPYLASLLGDASPIT